MLKIKNLNDLKSYCKTFRKPIIGIGIHGFNRLGIKDFYPNYQMICVSQGRDFKYLNKDTKSLVLGSLPRSEKRNALGILRSPRARPYINKFKKPYFFVYKPTKRVAQLCKKNGWKLIGQPALHYGASEPIKLENKLFFRQILEQAGIPKIPGEIISLSNLDWHVLARRYGKFVIQEPHRGGGKGTFFIFKKSDLARTTKKLLEIYEDIEVLVAKFIKGSSPSLTACITRHGIFSTNLQLQVLDIPEVRELTGSGMFCGHDWSSSRFQPSVNKKASNYALKIGRELKRLGYRGIFGLDMMVEQSTSQVYVLEYNPRLLGSMPTLTMVQLQNQEVPIVALHILEFLDVDYRVDFKKVDQLMKQPKIGAQLILSNKFGRPVKNQRSLEAGVYILRQGRLCFCRPGYRIKDLKTQEEFLLVDDVPYKNTRFTKRNERVLRLLTLRPILDRRTGGLNNWARRVVRKIYQELKFKPCGPRFES